ncbi:MAG: N-acetylneuraminic acid mutarotase [Limisphaerales bacterium]|jgi:N-acetylneuraminic acid mutarotase
MILRYFSAAFVFCFALCEFSATAEERQDLRNRAREEAVRRAGFERSLSKEMPEAVRELPNFGRIDWRVTTIPFIKPGPQAGVSGAGMVALGESIYFLAGFIPAGDGSDEAGHRTSRWAHRFDTLTGRWSQLPDIPGRREYTRSIASEGQVFLLGGGIQKPNPDVNYEARNEVFRFSVSAKLPSWQRVASLNVPRTHMAVGVAKGHLIVVGGNRYDFADGGYSSRTIQGVTETFELAKPENGWTQRAPIPGAPRGWSASASLNGQLYVLGGLSFVPTKEGVRGPKIKHAEALAYDPVGNQWTRLADPPVAISGWEGAAYHDRHIIAIGGVSKRWSDLAFVYDTKDDRWMKMENPLPVGGVLNDAGVCIIGDAIYIAGGEGPGGSHFNHFLIGQIRRNAIK